MACEEIRQRLTELREDKRELELVLPSLQGAGLTAAEENLANIKDQITVEEVNLAECEALAALEPGVSPRTPFQARVKRIECVAAGAELGDQEPYLIIASVDMLAGGGLVPVPSLHSVLVGPWSGVRPGSVRTAADEPKFWDLNQNPRVVKAPEDVIFLMALVENDGASPDAIRGSVQTSLKVSLVSNLNRDYDTLADTLRSAMVGAVDSFAGAGVGPGHLNFDGRIAVRHLSLTTNDLDRVDALGRTEKVVTFTQRKGEKVTEEYQVTVELVA